MAEGGFELDEFTRELDEEFTNELQYIYEETIIDKPISQDDFNTTEQLETKLSNLREGQPGYDFALNELIEARVKNFYKSFLGPRLPTSAFELRKDNLLYLKKVTQD